MDCCRLTCVRRLGLPGWQKVCTVEEAQPLKNLSFRKLVERPLKQELGLYEGFGRAYEELATRRARLAYSGVKVAR